MSVQLGLILPSDCSFDIIISLKDKYFPELNIYEENHRDKVFKISIHNDDSLTGIGTWLIFEQDEKNILMLKDDTKIKQFILSDFRKRKEHYIEDVNKWKEVIEYLLVEVNIKRVSVFLKSVISSFSDYKRFGQQICYLENLTCEYLMKIKEDEIITFVKR